MKDENIKSEINKSPFTPNRKNNINQPNGNQLNINSDINELIGDNAYL